MLLCSAQVAIICTDMKLTASFRTGTKKPSDRVDLTTNCLLSSVEYAGLDYTIGTYILDYQATYRTLNGGNRTRNGRVIAG